MHPKKIDILLFCRYLAVFVDSFSITWEYGIPAVTLIPVITHVINLSLGTAHFPARWKLARILPLLKSNDCDPLKPASYRPISQLPVLSKLTERSVQRQLLDIS